jgi:hypothetical protein
MSEPTYNKREVFGYDYLTCLQYAIRLLIGDLELAGINPETGTLCARYSKDDAKATVWFVPAAE